MRVTILSLVLCCISSLTEAHDHAFAPCCTCLCTGNSWLRFHPFGAKLTIIECPNRGWEVTLHSAANHIANDDSKGVVGERQKIGEIVSGHSRVDYHFRHHFCTIGRYSHSVDRSVAIERDGPADIHPSWSKTDDLDILWCIRRFCVYGMCELVSVCMGRRHA